MESFRSPKKTLAGRALRLLLPVLLVAVLLAPAAKAGQSAVTGIRLASANGVVTLPFEAPADGGDAPLYLVTYEQADETYRLVAGTPVEDGRTEVEYAAFDPAHLLGGQVAVFYYAIVTADLWEQHEAPGATKAVEATDGGITVSWQRKADAAARTTVPQEDVSLFLARVDVAREVVTGSLSAENANPSAAGKYVVQAGDTAVITFRTNAADPTVTNASFAGGEGIAWVYGETRGADGFLTVTGTATVPYRDATPGQTVPVEYAFTVGGRTFTHQDGEINGGSPLLYFNRADLSNIPLWMEATTPLEEEGVVQAGDTVHLLYNSETSPPFHVVRILAGERVVEGPGAFSEEAGRVSFALSPGNSESYALHERVRIQLVVADDSGTECTLDLPQDSAHVYVEETPDSKKTNLLAVEGLSEVVDKAYYAVDKGSQLQFTFTTESMRYKDQTCIVLTTKGGDTLVQPMQRVGNYREGYTFRCTIPLARLEKAQDGDWLRFSIRRGEEALSPTLYRTMPENATVTYFADFACTGVLVQYAAGQGGFGAATEGTAQLIDGDVVMVSITVNHAIRPQDTVVEMAGLTGTALEKKELETYQKNPGRYPSGQGLRYYIDGTGTKVVCFFRMQEVPDRQDGVPFGITVRTVRHALPGPAQLPTAACPFGQMVYWAPLQIQSPQIALAEGELVDDFDGEPYTIARDGAKIRVSFATGHPVLPGRIGTTAHWADGTAPLSLTYGERKESDTRYIYTAEFDMDGSPLRDVADLAVIRLEWELADARGQAGRTGRDIPTVGAARWAIRYQPLEITDLSLTSDNEKDGARYAKDGDTVTVRFTANHYVALDAVIAGKAVPVEDVRERGRTAYAFTCTLENGDLADLARVDFSFTATDPAGQALSFDQDASGVDNQLQYFAPLTAEGSITSGNARPAFAKNGDVITLATTANHQARVLSFTLAGRGVEDAEECRQNPGLTYRIPTGEAQMPEGSLAYTLQLEDPAGNTWEEAATSGITYDRTAPQIRLMTGYNGFTNKDVTLDLQFSDTFLDPAGLSCILNQKEQITSSSPKGAAYIHRISLTQEGRYSVSAFAVDLAGNRTDFEVVCKLVIDKTEPKIELELAQNAFQVGFTLDSIISIREEYLSSLVCTLTDSSGLHEWALDAPIETEGKKTVNITARDLSGNVSAPLTCDIFIDATPPQPLVTYENGQALDAGERNVLVGSGSTLAVALANLHVGSQAPDHFTVLELVDASGGVVADLLGAPAGTDGYSCPLPQFGDYTLRLQAADDVGNQTSMLEYPITYKQQYLPGEELLLKTPLAPLYASYATFAVACLAVLLVLTALGILTALIIRRRRRAQNLDEG